MEGAGDNERLPAGKQLEAQMAGHDLLLPDLLRLIPANDPAHLTNEHQDDWPDSETGSSFSNGGHSASLPNRHADQYDAQHEGSTSTAIIPWGRTAANRGNDLVP